MYRTRRKNERPGSTSSSSSSDDDNNAPGSRANLIGRLPKVRKTTTKSLEAPTESGDDKPKSIKNKLGFFRRSANNDQDSSSATNSKSRRTVNVVADVHRQTKSDRDDDSEDQDSDRVINRSQSNKSSDSGVHRRKRWDESEILDLTQKPRRKRWETDTGSAEIYRTGGKKIVLPKRGKPVPAPRVDKKPEEAFENEAFSSDHEDVLTIETVNNESPKIKMDTLEVKKFDSRDLESSDSEEKVSEPKVKTRSNKLFLEEKRSSSSTTSKTDRSSRTIFLKKRIESSDETTISTNEDMKPKSDPEIVRPKRPRRKKSRKKGSARKSATEGEEEVADKFVGVIVHKADMLEADYVTRNPMVRVHMVYASTGDYVRENEAMFTKRFDFQEKRTMIPVWEEQLVFQQDYTDLMVEGPGAVIILFEIVDLLGFDTSLENEKNWHKVAWAFLRPIGVNMSRHLEKKVRLQLYRPRKSFFKSNNQKCEVYSWWKSRSRVKYPSSLFVTISGIDPPKIEPVVYEQLHLTDLIDTPDDYQKNIVQKIPEDNQMPKWTRLEAQSCQIPNELLFETETSDNGCFYLTFSNNGKYLACALSDEYDFPILVYKVDEKKIHVRFNGHKNFIYGLDWSQDDRYILSVSSDQTAKIWDVEEKIIEHVQSLPHPSYVYCGKFFPDHPSIVVTGCYDHVARIWARTGESRDYELIQEFEAHQGFVNAICFQRDFTCLTGDALGVIVIWSAKRSRRSPIKKEWQISRKIKIRESQGAPINTILVHAMGSKLLVHSRNNGLRILDLQTGTVLRKFEGLKNHRVQIKACISPCGNLLFCGGENSTLNVWNTESGKLLASYKLEIGSNKSVSCVDYHPYDHMLAYSIYGVPLPVRILKFDRDSDGSNIGLVVSPSDEVFNQKSLSRSSTAKIRDFGTTGSQGSRNPDKLSARSLTSLTGSGDARILIEDSRDEEVQRNLKSRLRRFIESGQNLKTKSRLNGIIEKIDRILMYATAQKSEVDLDVELGARTLNANHKNVSAIKRDSFDFLELQNLTTNGRSIFLENEKSKSARETECFFSLDVENANNNVMSDSAMSKPALPIRKKARSSSSSFESPRGKKTPTVDNFVEEKPIEVIGQDLESSSKSNDTYVIDNNCNKSSQEKKSTDSNGNDQSVHSNATFIIDNAENVPIPKPRARRSSKVEIL